MPAAVIQRGDTVYLSTKGAHQAIPCMVVLASNNGRSLMLKFEAVVDFPGGIYAGNMPVFQRDDGRWVEAIGSHEVRIERAS